MSEFKNDYNAIHSLVQLLSHLENQSTQQITTLIKLLETSLKSQVIFEKEAQKDYPQFEKQINILRYVLNLVMVLKCHEFSSNDCEPSPRWQLKSECLIRPYNIPPTSSECTNQNQNENECDPLALDKLFFILSIINHLLHVPSETLDDLIKNTENNLERSTPDDRFGCLCMMSLRHIKHNRL